MCGVGSLIVTNYVTNKDPTPLTVHLVADAVCSRKKDDYFTAKEMMRDAGAVINCTETVLFQLLGKAGTPEFKAISQRIK